MSPIKEETAMAHIVILGAGIGGMPAAFEMRDAHFENPAYLFSKAKRIAFTLRKSRPATDLFLRTCLVGNQLSSKPAYPWQHCGKWRFNKTGQLPFGIIGNPCQV